MSKARLKTVEIMCPVNNKPVSTGLKIVDLPRWLGKTMMLQCPRCGYVHSWTPTRQMIGDDKPANPDDTLYLDS